jgi:integrase
VKREFATLHNIFEVAKEEWGYENLANPFDGMKLRENPARQRVLKPGELERLEQEAGNCRGLNRHYMLIAIHLAIETGMRQQEIFNLTWADVDLEKRLITIQRSKTDHKSEIEGRTIVMSFRAAMLLIALRLDLKARGRYSEQSSIFPMTKGAIKQSFSDLCKRAGVANFQFRDFRHEAASWFDRAGLTHAEHGLMMGHGKRTMRDRYITADLQSIQNKIDRYVLGGKTLEEFTGLDPHQTAVVLEPLLKQANRIWNKARKSGEPIKFEEALKRAPADLLSQSTQQEAQETSVTDSEKVIVLATRKQSAIADKKMGA